MFYQFQLLNALRFELKRNQELADRLSIRRKRLPKGSLVYKNGSYYRAVRYHGKREQIIIAKGFPDRKELISELKENRYIAKILPILENNSAVCCRALKQLQQYDPIRIKERLPAYYRDLDSKQFFLEGDIDPVAWKEESYEKNKAFPEHLKYKSERGLRTRSKAEADIATKLEQCNLNFRYEPELHLGTHLFYPDFCVLHPVWRRLIYWEHFGMMDQPEYAERSMEKLRIYGEHGIRIGENLIVTWETKKAPLNFGHINERIQTYLS